MIERLRDCQSREDKRSCLPPRDAHRQDTHKNESEHVRVCLHLVIRPNSSAASMSSV
jgi:hypothetical protein